MSAKLFQLAHLAGVCARAGYLSRRTISNYPRKTFALNTGATIPAIGLGTFQDKNEQEAAVLTALKAGYDTEEFIGNAIRKSGIPRNEIFITTKLWCNSFHPNDVELALDDSLRDLQTDYVDLYLLHYPCTFARGAERFPKGKDGLMKMGETTFVDTWNALSLIQKTGKVMAIGVSNFNQAELENLINTGVVHTSILSFTLITPLRCFQTPAVHQMEVHPFLAQTAFNDWHKSQGIHVMQFSPLGNQNSFYRHIYWSNGLADRGRLIDEPLLAELGKKYGKSPAQIALAWGVNRGRTVIPKSTIQWQIEQNLASEFLMEKEDLQRVDGLNLNMRFNMPNEAYRWPLYKGLDGA
ncbi:hypothetical protein BBP40_001393 [Aspergillus hancockii]|nr:hypothetical protein BBP40_001393 [Aspergillus hancockii]